MLKNAKHKRKPMHISDSVHARAFDNKSKIKLGKGGAAQVNVVGKRQIDHELLEMLETSGRSWSLKHGAKHIHLLIEGKIVLVLPRDKRRVERTAYTKAACGVVRRALHALEK